MKITISGKNIDVTEGLKAAVNEKLGKLEKYFTPDTNVIVTLSVEKERQKIEVTIPVKGNRSTVVFTDIFTVPPFSVFKFGVSIFVPYKST